MIEVELTCICPRIKIPDLGLSMVKGDRVYLTQAQARASRDLDLLRERAVVVKLVKRRHGHTPSSPSRVRVNPSKHPGQERIRDKAAAEAVSSPVPSVDLDVKQSPVAIEAEPVLVPVSEPASDIAETPSRKRGRKKFAVAPAFDSEGGLIEAERSASCISDSPDSSSTN